MGKLQKQVLATPNRITPMRPVVFDDIRCRGCNACINICQADVFIPNPEKGKTPLILFPDECFYCGCCVDACNVPGAIKFNHPLTQRIRFKRKKTGETFRVK